MDWTLEVVVLPVSDIDAAIAFYRDKVGFELDHDTRNEHMHVAQLTPRGSGCSIVVGDLPAQREMAPGSIRGLQLVVADAQAARQELLDRGVEASEIMVFDERDGGTFFGFSDPDGNTLGRPAAQGPGGEAADPGRSPRPVRRGHWMPEQEGHVVRLDDLEHTAHAHEFVGAEHGDVPFSIILVHSQPGVGPKLHRHPYAEVFVVEAGQATFRIGDRTLVIEEGTRRR